MNFFLATFILSSIACTSRANTNENVKTDDVDAYEQGQQEKLNLLIGNLDAWQAKFQQNLNNPHLQKAFADQGKFASIEAPADFIPTGDGSVEHNEQGKEDVWLSEHLKELQEKFQGELATHRLPADLLVVQPQEEERQNREKEALLVGNLEAWQAKLRADQSSHQSRPQSPPRHRMIQFGEKWTPNWNMLAQYGSGPVPFAARRRHHKCRKPFRQIQREKIRARMALEQQQQRLQQQQQQKQLKKKQQIVKLMSKQHEEKNAEKSLAGVKVFLTLVNRLSEEYQQKQNFIMQKMGCSSSGSFFTFNTRSGSFEEPCLNKFIRIALFVASVTLAVLIAFTLWRVVNLTRRKRNRSKSINGIKYHSLQSTEDDEQLSI